MSKNVIITVSSSKYYPDGTVEAEPVYSVGGVYEFGGDAVRFSYIEDRDSEASGIRTDVLIRLAGSPEAVLSRRGSVAARLRFRSGEYHGFSADTELGVLPMGLTTRRLCCTLDENGGTVEVEYDLALDRSFVARNIVRISLEARSMEKPT